MTLTSKKINEKTSDRAGGRLVGGNKTAHSNMSKNTKISLKSTKTGYFYIINDIFEEENQPVGGNK